LSPSRTTEEPQQAANRCKKHRGLPSLRIICKIARQYRYRNNDRCDPAHKRNHETDQRNNDPAKVSHYLSLATPLDQVHALVDKLVTAQKRCDHLYRLVYEAAVQEVEKVQDEIFDLAAQIAETECRTIEGLCAKIRCMMIFDGVVAIGEIRMDEGIADSMTLSIFRDLLAMRGTQAT
jgi:hypothetical protein